MTVIWLRGERKLTRMEEIRGTGQRGLLESDLGPLFYTTFAISVLSASLGLAKCLKTGVARPIGSGGILDGLLSARFLLAFFASGSCFVAKGFCVAYSVMVNNHHRD